MQKKMDQMNSGDYFNATSMTNTFGRGDTLNYRPRLSYEEKARIKQTEDAIKEVSGLPEMGEDGRFIIEDSHAGSWGE
jgi:hypothetical protein